MYMYDIVCVHGVRFLITELNLLRIQHLIELLHNIVHCIAIGMKTVSVLLYISSKTITGIINVLDPSFTDCQQLETSVYFQARASLQMSLNGLDQVTCRMRDAGMVD
jgi:hypothetical protein